MTAEEAATSLVENLPHDIEGIDAARTDVLRDPDFYRSFENRFFESLPTAGEDDSVRIRVAIGRFLLGQEGKAWDALHDQTGDVASYLRARILVHRGHWNEALAEIEKVLANSPTSMPLLVVKAESLAQLGDEEGLTKIYEAAQQAAPDSAIALCLRGMRHEVEGNYEEAKGAYQEALGVEAEHVPTLFRLAYCESLRGETEAAIELYEKLCGMRPTPIGALINLGILFEDDEDYQLAASCFQRVLDFDPNHVRARLYYKDAVASMRMFYDEEKERNEDKRAQVLRIPVTDFELSVRSRNCLSNMNVRTLGDLIRLSEQELLAFKNFGETSLLEIKNILNQKGLRLGMMPREDTGMPPPMPGITPESGEPESVMYKPVSDLDLSVRSRKALDVLGVGTVGELMRMSEARLMACKNFGQTSLSEIKKKLADLGMNLPEN